MNIKAVNNIFLVGIKGAGMANIALFLKDMGKHVVGSDLSEEFITDNVLAKRGIEIFNSFNGEVVPQETDLLVYSASHGGISNPQVKEAQKRGIHVMHQAQFLGEIMSLFEKSIAVCGTHGKTTTASLLAFLLMKLNVQPSYIVGTSGFNDVPGGGYAGKQYLVLEADEYAVDPPVDTTPKLQFFHPQYAICTSIDFDHPDVYKDIEETKSTFKDFFKKIKQKLIICADDENCLEITKSLPVDSYITFGFSPYSQFMASNVVTVNDTTLFDVTRDGVSVGSFSTKLVGDKMIGNVTGVIASLVSLGFDPELIHTHLNEFNGAKRRFEHVGSAGGVELYDDYAHHPHEIEATLEGARARFGDRPIHVIFQPHTFSRTEALKEEFVDELSHADEVYIAPIFASARENPQGFTITSQSLVDIAKKKGYKHIQTFNTTDELVKLLKKNSSGNEVIFTMGAGDVYKMKNDIIRTFHG